MTRTIEERLATLESIVESLRPVDLTGDKFADFSVRKSPPQWLESGGHDYVGEPISATTPEFCDAIASFLDWQASKDEEKNYSYVNDKGKTVFPAQYARKDAARARAWAARLRENRRTPAQQPTPPRRSDDRGFAPPRRQAPPAAASLVDYNDGNDGIPF